MVRSIDWRSTSSTQYSLDWRQADFDVMSPAVVEFVRQLVHSRVVLYHAVDERVHATTSRIIIIIIIIIIINNITRCNYCMVVSAR